MQNHHAYYVLKLHNLFASVHQDGGYQNVTSELRLLQGVYRNCILGGFLGVSVENYGWNPAI